MKINYLNKLTHIALQMMALQFNLRPSLKSYMKSADGWTNFTIGLKTASGNVNQAIEFQNGRVSVLNLSRLPMNHEKKRWIPCTPM